MAVSRPFDPLALDVERFAQVGHRLQGEWPAAELARWSQDGPTPSAAWLPVRWHIEGRLRAVSGGESEVWLDLRVQAQAHLSCQRCLGPVAVPLVVEGSYRFVRDEALAAELDADSEEDVLVLSRRFDVRAWIEDELLLAQPLVPMHEVCPEPLPMPVQAEATEAAPEADERPHPFAVLQQLKRREGPS